MINIYTDGSCLGNNTGAAAVVVLTDNNELIYANVERFKDTTNNRMELTALLMALELTQTKFKDKKCTIYSDSKYCVNTWNEWIKNWANNEWRKSNNKPIENLSLIKELYNYYTIDFIGCQVIVKHLHGHIGYPGNELADALCTLNSKKFLKTMNSYSIEVKI